MKRTSLIMVVAGLVAFGGLTACYAGSEAQAGGKAAEQPATAGETVTFAVENMTCGTCPITVRKAMEKVAGVRSVAVDFDAKTATVVFDPAVATPQQIGAASTEAGYPAAPAS